MGSAEFCSSRSYRQSVQMKTAEAGKLSAHAREHALKWRELIGGHPAARIRKVPAIDSATEAISDTVGTMCTLRCA
jgi:hypothetical protein